MYKGYPRKKKLKYSRRPQILPRMNVSVSELCDVIETYSWRIKLILRERAALVARAAWSEDDEVYADYLDDLYQEYNSYILDAQALL